MTSFDETLQQLRETRDEMILRGEKTVEYRSQPTKNRGRVYIDAALGTADAEQLTIAPELAVTLSDLPRGVLAGTITVSRFATYPLLWGRNPFSDEMGSQETVLGQPPIFALAFSSRVTSQRHGISLPCLRKRTYPSSCRLGGQQERPSIFPRP